MVVDSESWTQREIGRHREEGERRERERERAKINNNVVTHMDNGRNRGTRTGIDVMHGNG